VATPAFRSIKVRAEEYERLWAHVRGRMTLSDVVSEALDALEGRKKR